MDSRSPWLMMEKAVQNRKARNLSDTTSKRERYTVPVWDFWTG
jgi:hypothetical protein